ncbi:DNA oxidative demethylase ALKBH2 [Colletotrichum sp. SAR 10_70]|nr:DNA oxidative demethylase ALKBH2 [Colletotrichum sp. SAR 10_71]KAI8191319.1 DNA oxidative demethylase ALKBH2 [Colletotrichum sp. SAR 10_65]KAI8197161.1 DNA oxidative demethylase ALKBH2 [Colletotrichum sp. SAR 10_70]KAI8209529.1 DNA oxidative demethylase ALKBH2 [Colletotrichum sp. SAR 10_76]KAI8231284.1 DNA oxidative demethylase ALKBH2 [Colletotrichum sp. SAR 10_86]KAI8249431.1 DNA oxidative demethylase ALKBH2 [Colletotrichum sp. SAR 10_77]
MKRFRFSQPVYDYIMEPEKKRKLSPASTQRAEEDDEPTEVKLAMLSSLHPHVEQEMLLDVLLAHNGSVAESLEALAAPTSVKKPSGVMGAQSSLRNFATKSVENRTGAESSVKRRLLSKKGTTLHLYDPDDIAEHTPCSVIHNFLPAEEANDLLRELLREAETFEKNVTFKLFDNVVASPHTTSFYVESYDEIQRQKTDYLYNGAKLTDIRRITPQLVKVKPKVAEAVNAEIQKRIATRYPGGKKLRFQSPKPWAPNSAFVNCYDGPQENVGYHSDQLTYLGPRAVIGSLSLGVAREFRVRRIIPKDGDSNSAEDPDAEGQISIHLPHNSLLVMHAEMQEEWKHSIAPAQSIDPHPVAGNKRINITYRDYKANMHPRYTPKCDCGIPCVLRVVQRKKESHGKYFWMCHGGNAPGKESCSFFQWGRFDDDGNPIWTHAKPKPSA